MNVTKPGESMRPLHHRQPLQPTQPMNPTASGARDGLQEVMLAEPRGFCAGVDRAIEIVERALTKFGAPI